jgi:CMP-N,N'-diacetyllegionaminic acid synthase
MINQRRVIAIIPARGGSKGVPQKNIKMICGKPLIVWTIEKALKSRFIDELIVSTDDDEIAHISAAAGASVPFRRPAELATDTAPTMAAIDHALDYFRAARDMTFEYVVLLEPTSPLREDDDIDRMLEQLEANAADYDSIISVGEVAEHPSIVKRLVGGSLAPFCPELQTTTRRQDNEAAYFPYAVGYIAKTSSLAAERTFYGKRAAHYRIKRYQNYEIDDLYDFLAVASVMRHEWNLE